MIQIKIGKVNLIGCSIALPVITPTHHPSSLTPSSSQNICCKITEDAGKQHVSNFLLSTTHGDFNQKFLILRGISHHFIVQLFHNPKPAPQYTTSSSSRVLMDEEDEIFELGEGISKQILLCEAQVEVDKHLNTSRDVVWKKQELLQLKGINGVAVMALLEMNISVKQNIFETANEVEPENLDNSLPSNSMAMDLSQQEAMRYHFNNSDPKYNDNKESRSKFSGSHQNQPRDVTNNSICQELGLLKEMISSKDNSFDSENMLFNFNNTLALRQKGIEGVENILELSSEEEQQQQQHRQIKGNHFSFQSSGKRNLSDISSVQKQIQNNQDVDAGLSRQESSIKRQAEEMAENVVFVPPSPTLPHQKQADHKNASKLDQRNSHSQKQKPQVDETKGLIAKDLSLLCRLDVGNKLYPEKQEPYEAEDEQSFAGPREDEQGAIDRRKLQDSIFTSQDNSLSRSFKRKKYNKTSRALTVSCDNSADDSNHSNNNTLSESQDKYFRKSVLQKSRGADPYVSSEETNSKNDSGKSSLWQNFSSSKEHSRVLNREILQKNIYSKPGVSFNIRSRIYDAPSLEKEEWKISEIQANVYYIKHRNFRNKLYVELRTIDCFVGKTVLCSQKFSPYNWPDSFRLPRFSQLMFVLKYLENAPSSPDSPPAEPSPQPQSIQIGISMYEPPWPVPQSPVVLPIVFQGLKCGQIRFNIDSSSNHSLQQQKSKNQKQSVDSGAHKANYAFIPQSSPASLPEQPKNTRLSKLKLLTIDDSAPNKVYPETTKNIVSNYFNESPSLQKFPLIFEQPHSPFLKKSLNRPITHHLEDIVPQQISISKPTDITTSPPKSLSSKIQTHTPIRQLLDINKFKGLHSKQQDTCMDTVSSSSSNYPQQLLKALSRNTNQLEYSSNNTPLVLANAESEQVPNEVLYTLIIYSTIFKNFDRSSEVYPVFLCIEHGRQSTRTETSTDREVFWLRRSIKITSESLPITFTVYGDHKDGLGFVVGTNRCTIDDLSSKTRMYSYRILLYNKDECATGELLINYELRHPNKISLRSTLLVGSERHQSTHHSNRYPEAPSPKRRRLMSEASPPKIDNSRYSFATLKHRNPIRNDRKFFYYSGKNVKFAQAKRFSYNTSMQTLGGVPSPGPGSYELPSVFDRHRPIQ